MSPTPVTFASPTAPASYSWEATNEAVAERYGVPIERIVRFDLNTSPTPPELVGGLLAANRFETGLSEYPPSDYRRLVAAAANRYGVAREEIVVGAGADEILDLIGKAFLPTGSAAIIPTPSYAMYRVITEQRGARVIGVPRLGAAAGWAIDAEAIRAAVREAEAGPVAVIWLCSPNNPTALAEPDGVIERLLVDLDADATAIDRDPPVVVLDEAYAEFAGRSLVDLRRAYPRLIVVRTASKAYALAGLRVGFALATPEIIQRINIYRPPGSVSTISVTVVTEALLDASIAATNVAAAERERARLTAALTEIGWSVGPSVTNFLLIDFDSPERAAATAEALLRRALVPRTFGAGHPIADHLRFTIRASDENDRLIDAAASIERERAGDTERAGATGTPA